MRYFIGFLVTIGLIIVLILLLVGGGNKHQVVKSKTLDSYAYTGAEVRAIIDGPITSQQTHQEVQITVSNTNVNFSLINGYENSVSSSKDYANNVSSYSVFLHALSHAGYTLGDNNPALKDERGYCPLGQRYIFELIDDNGHILQRYWSTSCGKPKTYQGSTSLTLSLFEAQVPDYDTLTENAQGLQ